MASAAGKTRFRVIWFGVQGILNIRGQTDCWLDVDREYCRTVEMKRLVLSSLGNAEEKPEDFVLLVPEGAIASTRHGGDRGGRAGSVPTGAADQSGQRKYVMAAHAVCFPDRWSPEAKMGKTVDEIHTSVPHYTATISTAVDGFLRNRLKVGDRAYIRFNYTFQEGGNLLIDAGAPQQCFCAAQGPFEIFLYVGRYINQPDRGDTVDECVPTPTLMHDGRLLRPPASLHDAGFALERCPTSVRNFRDDDEVVRSYYPEMRELIKRASGATRVMIFDHTVRNTASTSLNAQAGGTAAPVPRVHCDYTADGAPRRLMQFADDGVYSHLRQRKLVRADIEQLADQRFMPPADRQRVAQHPGNARGASPARGVRHEDGAQGGLLPLRAAVPRPDGRELLPEVEQGAPVVLLPADGQGRRVPRLQGLRQAGGRAALRVPHGVRRPPHHARVPGTREHRDSCHRLLHRGRDLSRLSLALCRPRGV
ncbi:unnamed protein product [Prorocentrum cordatum]|uniref:Uncharacterized protein n=1 Tax=Prorocentrum cordatum TaxID=2364126 RepID=A0ABN9QWC3_9DINO|nr:unnamed protein product [Polarella glacialis]